MPREPEEFDFQAWSLPAVVGVMAFAVLLVGALRGWW